MGIACIAFACMPASAASAAAEPTIVYVHEAKPAYEAQLQGHQIESVTFNRRIRSMRITLKNGQHVLYRYGRK